jgi:hypothetical protein
MRLYTIQECEEWLRDRKRPKPEAMADVQVERITYPHEAGRLYHIAHWIGMSLPYRQPVLLWMTEWSVWPSSENWHLYYKLRDRSNDNRLLHEAPGHLFLEHEAEDLTSFLQVAMLNGWGGYVLTQANYLNAFFSHDEYIDFFAGPHGNLGEVRDALGPAKSPSPPA